MNLSNISPYKKRIRFSNQFHQVNQLLKQHSIETICHNGRCPNINECFSRKKLTFLILGNICTRHCLFCNVKHGTPIKNNLDESLSMIQIIKKLNLNYIVITSVTRDDIDDGGAHVYTTIVNEIKKEFPKIKIEVLIPDFQGALSSLNVISQLPADVIGHNIETTKSLYPFIRPKGHYQTALYTLKTIKELNKNKLIKSGFMVGLGETGDEIKQVLNDLYKHAVDIVTIGQYFQPSLKNIKVSQFYSDEEFKHIEEYAKEIGFQHVASGRFVRSSYYAEEIFK